MKPLVMLLSLLAAVAAVPVAADPRTEVQQAFERVLAAGQFRAQAQGHAFGPELPPVAGEVAVIFPDRAHVRTSELEFIVLPEGAWVSAFGLWTATDPALLPVTRFEEAAMREAIASIRDVRYEGEAQAAQCAAKVYSFKASGQLPGASADGDVRLWVCADHGRPARLEATDAGRRLMLDFDWSRPVVIRPPPSGGLF